MGKRSKARKSSGKRKSKRPKGFSKLTRVQSRKQAVYGHAITHSGSYQKSKKPNVVKREHDHLVKAWKIKDKTPM